LSNSLAVELQLQRHAMRVNGAGMTVVVSNTLSTGVIPAEAGTQYTDPQGIAVRGGIPK
jgi:hypothetical protein